MCFEISGMVNSAINSLMSSKLVALASSSRCGINRHPINDTNNRPTSAVIPPTGAKSNILKGAPRDSSLMAAMMMFGGVPIKVAIPPKMVAKDKGINERPTALFALRAV